MTDDERRGRLMIAVTTARNVQAFSDHKPPQFPLMWAGPRWPEFMDEVERNIASQQVLNMFGLFRDAVTSAESRAAGELATLLRAWRELLNLGGPEMDGMAAVIRAHVRACWRSNIAEPPQHADIDRVSTRLSRRYDLLPRHVREVG